MTLFATSVMVLTPLRFASGGRTAVGLGQLPEAVQEYHRGLMFFPADRTLQRDLETVRDLVGYPPGTRPAPPGGLRHTVADTDVFALAVVGGLLLAVGVAARLTTRPRWATGLALAGGVGFLLAVGVTGYLRLAPPSLPLVLGKATVVRAGNGPSYPPRLDAPLPAGAEVERLGDRGGWVRVRVANGVVGWVPEADVLN